VHTAFQPHFAYSASAGSGKTFALSVRYISLLFLGEESSTILAATFTNKAASEMKQRVVNSLLHLSENPIFLGAISEQTGLSRDEILAKQPEVLANFLASPNFIVTLDSFFTSILRSASLYIDLEPDFVTKEVDPQHKEAYFLEEIVEHSLLPSLVKLTINIDDRRFLKIFELMQDFYKIDPLLPPHRPVPTSLEAIEAMIHQKREELHRLVVASGASKSAIKNFEPSPVGVLFKRTVFDKAHLYDHRNYKKYLQKYPQMDRLFLELKALLASWATAKEAVVLSHLFTIFDYYKNANIATAKALGILSFDDLTYFTYRLLHESLDKDFLYFKIDSHFRHILLDEFQDTSTIQFLMLQPLIDEIFSGVGQDEFRTFFYVGDTKQSLYRFRGGVEALFDRVAEAYGITVAQMDTNYRSSQQVVEQVNRWFEPHMPEFYPAKARAGAMEGYVAVVESEHLVEEVLTQLEWLLNRGVDLSSIALLVATNKDGATLQEACHARGIATRLKTSSSLKHTPKVAALVAMVSYLFAGEEIDAMPFVQRIGYGTLTELKEAVAWYSSFMQPLEVLHRLMGQFDYFEEDLNLLKLLEFASEFADIATFLEEFELSNIEVASHAKEGAMIMTIHGSKGLEFDHVLVVDRLRGMAPDRTALMYDYDESLHLKRVVYKIGGRERFDADYQALLAQQKVLQHKDRLNLLYVALTRAVESMIVVRKPKGSMFDLLGIRPLVVGHLPTKVATPTPPPPTPHVMSRLVHYGVQEVETLVEEEQDHDAICFGEALHYTLEMMRLFDLESLEEALLGTQNRYGLELSADQLDEITRRVRMLLETEGFMERLSEAEITKEQSLYFEGALKQVDLILEYDHGCVVVDYKSSKKYHQKHLEQVGLYQRAVESILKKPTQALLVYLLKEEVVLHEV